MHHQKDDRGTVSGSVAKVIRQLVPHIADLLAANKPAKGGDADQKPDAASVKDVAGKKPTGGKTKGKKVAKQPLTSPLAKRRSLREVCYAIFRGGRQAGDPSLRFGIGGSSLAVGGSAERRFVQSITRTTG